ncbi:putative mitochondrial protein [Nicotiana attenuata]|uniref:Mitochondrial protein n=1 Tax=Nicotiana attenuata TaxID=49451 RepID=A0A314LIA3_NICAT|nr:putative mitochondrial protein [Nicotiana attenuata]
MQAKRAKGLCYFCDEKYTPGHKCNLPKQLYVMNMEVSDTEGVEEVSPTTEGNGSVEEWTTMESETPMLSLCALSGLQGAQTNYVLGYNDKRPIQNSLTGVSPTILLMGDILKGWDARSAQLRYYLVLGALWTISLGPITMDYFELTMALNYQRMHHLLKGISEECKVSSSKVVNKLKGEEVEFFILQISVNGSIPEDGGQLQTLHMTIDGNILAPIEQLLLQYQQVFVEPTTLPPQSRAFDHRIPLQLGTKPVNVRPYRYPSMKEDIIVKLSLGHFISAEGVSTNPRKIQAVQKWPIPTTLKQLRGFPGLAGYYRKFIKGYGMISRSLTELLRKNGFLWSPVAKLAFCALKAALTSALVLALPNHDIPFVVESGASGSLSQIPLISSTTKMEAQANDRRTDKSFKVGDWIFVKLQPYRQSTFAVSPYNKLASRYFGPYPIVERVGVVAYKILLPPEKALMPISEAILARRLIKKSNKVFAQCLIKWTDLDSSYATWELASTSRTQFLAFTHEDNGVAHRGGIDTDIETTTNVDATLAAE